MGLVKAKWTRNFKKNTARRPNIPEMKTALNESLYKIPLNENVVDRFSGLYAEAKSGVNRIRRIFEEVIMNFGIKCALLLLSFCRSAGLVDACIDFRGHFEEVWLITELGI